ncbi:ATP-binding protein [Herbaspirillum rhizosphaerae]|uniref:ATP-binding protein n=1 Tax=Herbaspirillum rhizosphaerae TaxID=346179 RepID=UPI000B2280B4|nr:ATP-binding protein [Herbaspirillum rhizosphaerae]
MNLDPASAQYGFLKGTGTLGQLIFDHDWSDSPLGPISQWPQSLKTAVSLMLNSRQPMWLGWGDQVTFLYNDAYIDVLSQAKHPWALGRPAAVVWAEIWDICGPIADKVFQHGEATFVDDVRLFMSRASGPEENYFSFSYSPIRDESGEVGGLFCPNAEMTAKHLNARRLRTLSELASGALMERTAGAAAATAATILAKNPDDIPFALLYLSDCSQRQALLEQSVHLLPLSGIAPECISLHTDETDDGQLWPVARVLSQATQELVDVRHIDTLPLGLADQHIRQAIMLPLASPGQDRPIGVLICGINPTRPLDDDYQTFFNLLAGQLTAAIQQARAAEAETRRANLLAELDQAKTAFFSNVSHEFRTPLTLMMGPLDDMLSDQEHELAPAQRERARMLRRNTQRLQKLVNALLDFSRIQAGRTQASYTRVDLAAFTSDLASTFRSTIEGAGLIFEVDCPPLQEETYIDATMWEKIVLNLLSNAFKFTFEGKISLQLSGHGDHVMLTVSDTGVGIAADQLPLVFKRFHRVEGSHARTHEGSGIGLALVRDLVNLQGGAISVNSQLQRGSSFVLTIPAGRTHLPADRVSDSGEAVSSAHSPLADAYAAEADRWIAANRSEDEEQKALLPPPNAGRDPALCSGARILVADDNADMRDYLSNLLQPHWEVESVANGADALAAARAYPHDLILSDVMMPQLDGFGLLAQLRADEATRDIPFILLSARAGEEARLEGLAAGADDYLVKPFSSRELIARIESMLLRSQIRAMEKRHGDRMSTIFAQAPVAIAITRGPNHIFELANAPYLELIGNRPIIGKSVRESLPELEGQSVLDLLDDVYRHAEPYIGRSLAVSLRRSSTGMPEERFFDFVYQPMLKPDGSIEGIAVVAFEVTELTRARQAAEVANRTKDEFLAMLGHELRNPLTPILTAVHLMRLRGGGGVERECSVIERQARHLVRLVDDLLDVSRVAQGKINLQKKKIEIADVIAKAIETASPLLEERHHRLTVNVPSQGLPVHADPERLTQVLANLLTNAGKYTENRGHIRIDATLDHSQVVVDVRDNGIGIKAEMLPHVFEMFAQETQAIDRAGGGLGLGLAIVRSLTELHGGSVHVHSAGAGMGSVFTIKLPAVMSETSPLLLPRPSEDAIALAPTAEGCAILVVDDNQDAAQILAELLAMQGHEVRVAYDGPSALDIVQHFTPRIALLDIGLPIMDGYEVAAHLRALPHLQGIGLIALTGYGQASDRLRSANAGFDHHLVKPVDIDVVEELIRTTLIVRPGETSETDMPPAILAAASNGADNSVGGRELS